MEKIKSFTGKYKMLSNFYPCSIEYDWMVFGSVEKAFQAAKTFDIRERKRILLAPTEKDAKRMGRSVALRSDWEAVKGQIMLNFLRKKFKKDEFRELLLSTGDAYLENSNDYRDTFWGTYKGEGKNMLGKFLMQVRKEQA